jgi:hypothetical protein|tara:strand:- start:180 stop:686 length:507 start_codon:yes stop_codon:yes gene_type:complete
VREGHLTPTDALELTASSDADVVASREGAVNRIFTGGTLMLLSGPTLFVGGFFFETDLQVLGMLAVLGSIALAGTGMTLIGLAAKHLRRFGGPLGSSFLTALGGFGASVLVWFVSMAMLMFNIAEGSLAGALNRFAGMGMVFFTVMLVAVVIAGLIRWAAGASIRDES